MHGGRKGIDCVASRKRQPPDIPAILEVLANHDVEYVLVGSVAIQAWGVDVALPGDLDIVPMASRDNLSRLDAALRDMRAESWPVTGRWFTDERGEREWENLAPDDPEYMKRLSTPNPEEVSTFDSMYSTIHGDFDIVPTLAGTYDKLVPCSHRQTVHGVANVPVIGVDELLARLTIPRRKRDAPRVAELRDIQRGMRR